MGFDYLGQHGLCWCNVDYGEFNARNLCSSYLEKKSQKLRKETGNDKIMTEQEATPLSFKEMVNECLIRPLKFVVTEPLLDLVCAFVALIYAYLYAFSLLIHTSLVHCTDLVMIKSV